MGEGREHRIQLARRDRSDKEGGRFGIRGKINFCPTFDCQLLSSLRWFAEFLIMHFLNAYGLLARDVVSLADFQIFDFQKWTGPKVDFTM